ncbi:MAG: hypothetical protein AB4911_12190 [Oscillochloridaceae bacterium umkhey_bin13]
MREQFSPEEWADLCAAPFAAAMYVATAEGHQIDYTQEMTAFLQALRLSRRDGGTLARAVRRELGTRRGNRLGTGPGAISRDDRAAMLALLHRAGTALNRAAGDEAAPFGAWILDLAQQTAAASRTGGLLGLGGVAISQAEANALETIRHTLNGT